MSIFRSLVTLAILLAVLAAACGSNESTIDRKTATEANGEPDNDPVGSFVGLPIEDAIALAEQGARPWRIGREDDTIHDVTRDYVVGRVTFEVDGGVVTEAHIEPGPDDPPPPAPTKP